MKQVGIARRLIPERKNGTRRRTSKDEAQCRYILGRRFLYCLGLMLDASGLKSSDQIERCRSLSNDLEEVSTR